MFGRFNSGKRNILVDLAEEMKAYEQGWRKAIEQFTASRLK